MNQKAAPIFPSISAETSPRTRFLARTMLPALLALPLLLGPLLILGAPQAQAQSQNDERNQFTTTATALDAGTLLTEQTRIKLWGIEPINNTMDKIELRARTRLDDLIAGKPVRCKVMATRKDLPVAQCFTSQNMELSLEMLRSGFAVTDRPAVMGTIFEKSFLDSERQAYNAGKGAWAGISRQDPSDTDTLIGLTLIGIAIGSIIGFAAVTSLALLGFRRMVAMQREQFDTIFSRQDHLREREKFVVAAMFEAEINANKIKLEAFLVIYEEMLRNLRDTVRQQRFRQTGEIIHEQPPLNRAVFDAYKDRMELLGPQLAADLTKIYSSIEPNPEYITLDPDLPIEKAIRKVEEIIEDAKGLIPPTDKALSGLSVIIRDRKKSALSGLPGQN